MEEQIFIEVSSKSVGTFYGTDFVKSRWSNQLLHCLLRYCQKYTVTQILDACTMLNVV